MSKEIVHKDIFNREIKVGDAVVLSSPSGYGNRLTVGTVQKLNPKMVNVMPVGQRNIQRRYAIELMVVTDNPGVSAFMLMSGSGTKKRGQR